jgi:25S rRNA (uracil2634-N3)-methyltransferase
MVQLIPNVIYYMICGVFVLYFINSRDGIELLVSFFENAQGALAPRGSIIVTLFEGVPYTLWNIRDLARHSGLQVEKSFKFQAKAYPGYRHARTLGVIKGKDGKEGGGWRGEERESRSYVFMRKGGVVEDLSGRPGKRKKGEDSDSESEDESSVAEAGSNAGWSEDEQDNNEGDGEEEEADEENWDGIHDSEEDHPEESEPEAEE